MAVTPAARRIDHSFLVTASCRILELSDPRGTNANAGCIPTAAGRFAGNGAGEWRRQPPGSQPFATLSNHLNSWMNWHMPFGISLPFAIAG